MAPSSCSPLVTHPQSDNRADRGRERDGEKKWQERGREMEDKREEKIWAREEGDKEARKRAAVSGKGVGA